MVKYLRIKGFLSRRQYGRLFCVDSLTSVQHSNYLESAASRVRPQGAYQMIAVAQATALVKDSPAGPDLRGPTIPFGLCLVLASAAPISGKL